MGEYFSLERVIQYFPKIIARFPTTLLIVVVAMLLGSLIGMVFAFIRINRVPVLRQLVAIYLSFVRGTPQIVQLFLVYYGAPALVYALFHIDINRVDAIYFVLIAYGLNEGAYLTELFRGGLSAIPAGQYEAGYAVGLTKAQTFLRIVTPQAARIVLPSLGVEVIQLFQGTSLASSVGVLDLMGRASQLGTITRHSVENYFCAAVIFVVVSIVLEFVFHKVNAHLSYGHKEGQNG
jgi:L-cystine transport system permease protein